MGGYYVTYGKTGKIAFFKSKEKAISFAKKRKAPPYVSSKEKRQGYKPGKPPAVIMTAHGRIIKASNVKGRKIRKVTKRKRSRKTSRSTFKLSLF